ncbi:hypothetical protein [Paenarthrobacter sp. C1]|uniref:hypothetical protein n=1 Tax=Paenarthrobacter sp. C1 TaxID=3400220 RepID=UPI003BF461F3
MTQKNDEEHTGGSSPETGEAAQPERAFGSFEGSKKDERPEESAVSGFTEEQISQLHGMFAAVAPSGRFARLRGWARRYREQAQTFIRNAAPRDEDTDFDQETFTGRLAAKASKHRSLSAFAAVTSILVIGGLWSMILGGGLPVPLAAAIVVAVLGTGLVFILALRRGSR